MSYEKKKKFIVDILFCAIIAALAVFTVKYLLNWILPFVVAFAVSAKDSKAPLQFSEDGKFKIMQVNDTQDKHKMNKKTVKFLKAALEAEKPDLVVIAGDMLADFYPFASKEKLEKALFNGSQIEVITIDELLKILGTTHEEIKNLDRSKLAPLKEKKLATV